MADDDHLKFDLTNKIIDFGHGREYILLRFIEKGGFAKVYTCREYIKDRPGVTTPPPYACKVIPKNGTCNPANLQRELDIIRAVHHENVLELVDFLETKDFFYFVTPYMRGGDLLTKINRLGRFSEAEARRVLTQIARGLEYLHSKDICHRDLKPENILCSGEEHGYTVKIADFGLSRIFGEDGLMSTSCGTPSYVAPEVAAGSHPYTNACDIWGFGIIAYMLFTGDLPFKSGNPEKLEKRIKSGRYNLKNFVTSNVSIKARNFIARVLVVDPGARPSAKELLRDPWMLDAGMPDVDADDGMS